MRAQNSKRKNIYKVTRIKLGEMLNKSTPTINKYLKLHNIQINATTK